MFSWQLQSIKNVYFLFSSFSSLGTWNKGLKVDPTISFRLSYMFIIPSLNFSTDECTIDQISNKVKDRSSGKDHGPSTKALVVFCHVSNPQRQVQWIPDCYQSMCWRYQTWFLHNLVPNLLVTPMSSAKNGPLRKNLKFFSEFIKRPGSKMTFRIARIFMIFLIQQSISESRRSSNFFINTGWGCTIIAKGWNLPL